MPNDSAKRAAAELMRPTGRFLIDLITRAAEIGMEPRDLVSGIAKIMIEVANSGLLDRLDLSDESVAGAIRLVESPAEIFEILSIQMHR